MSYRPSIDDACYNRHYVAGVLLCLAGAALGMGLPDIDLLIRIPVLIDHRSIVTHSVLLPLLLLGPVQAAQALRPEGQTTQLSHPHAEPRLRLFTLGLCTSLAVHFCFDLFPYHWYGYATIYAPVIGRLSGLLSFGWLAANALISLYIGGWLLRRKEDFWLALLCLGGAFGAAGAREPRIAVYALLALVVVAPLAFILPRPRFKAYAGNAF